MYIRSGTSSSYSYSTNGGDWYHYRVFPQKRVFDSPSAWKGRAIYQLLTDRFARPLSVGSGSLYSNCTDTTTYCGGTWQGVIEQLQYIANMGFDAIWISPIVSNTATGYHGYYAYDHSKLNDKFGTSTDLQNLLAAAHSLNISVMYDIVANHMGPTATGSMSYYPSPLNKDSNYHSPVCTIDYNKTPINQTEYEVCRINSVNPDINTEDPETIKWLTDSYKNHFSSYGPDGLRVDTFKHVNVTFWKSFLGNLSLFSMGEVLDGNTAYVASYQKVANSVLNYPLYYNVIQPVFGSKNSMTRITDQLSNNNQFVDSTVLGNFVDNHDINRILTTTGDTALARNALILSLFTDGIPIVYQGFEQAYTDSSSTRLPIWPTKFKTLPSLGFYQYLSIFLRVRRDYGGQAFVDARHTALATGASYHAFQRGPFLVVLTNVGAAGANVAVSVPTAQSFGRRTLRNVLIPSDVVSPDASGVYNVTLVAGEPKVYM
ncbi:alpha-amylase 1 [Zopfochytrium polystomum]|nr:alpha-amylase 1 [Zopfochytrium polystomum]